MGNSLILSFLIGLGGFAGALSRYGLNIATQKISFSLPLGTLAANFLGCLLIGIITGISERGDLISHEARLVMATGFCGGFTTMSSFMCEISHLLRDSKYFYAGVYTIMTFSLSMLAFVAGVLIAKFILKTRTL